MPIRSSRAATPAQPEQFEFRPAAPPVPAVPRLGSVYVPPVIEQHVSAEFFQIVDARNTLPDGTLKDPNLRRRMTHPTCLRCQASYRAKFPGRAFGIECDGIYAEPDFVEIAGTTQIPYEEVRQLLDISYWASHHIRLPNSDGDLVPFIARDYQEEQLSCTARYQIDRWSRGLGKTTTGIIKEIHTATTRKRYNILVACPAKAQAQKWYDEIDLMTQGDDELRESIVQKKQAPYFVVRFANGSTINIFTTGSKSGQDADTIRSQSPRRIRLDEQDLLNPGDYKALMPLLRRYPDSQFHGSSTPTGKRETFWEMCVKFPDYRELHFPIQRHPDYTPEFEIAARREARTEINFLHEFLAEFGDQEGGVFKATYVDACRQHYLYTQCKYDPAKEYFMGVDWNGGGTGTRIRVVEYDTITHIRKVVDHSAISSSTMDTIDEIRKLNREWHCKKVYIDAGFGYVQDELLRLLGLSSMNADDRRLKDVHVIDFGANLVTNKLVPNRGHEKYINDNEMERPTKPFMVEGCVMTIESGLFVYSDEDSLLDEQLRAYRVKTYTRHGWANSYESRMGDHDLDALMLAVLAVEQTHGLTKEMKIRHVAGLQHLPAFGAGQNNPQPPRRGEQAAAATTRETISRQNKIPSRNKSDVALLPARPAAVNRDAFGNARTVTVYPPKPAPGRTASRTAVFTGSKSKPTRGGLFRR